MASYAIFGRGELISEGELPVPSEDQGIEGVLRDPASVLAVTGGTGDFEDVHGETHLGHTFIFHHFR